jgi:hypothetical protein
MAALSERYVIALREQLCCQFQDADFGKLFVLRYETSKTIINKGEMWPNLQFYCDLNYKTHKLSKI